MLNFKNMKDKLFYDPTGQILISAIFGLALSFMFVRVCKDNCVVYYAPKIEDIQDKVFKIDETCYVYKSTPTKCNEKPLENYNQNITPENLLKSENVLNKLFS